jgi:hypothetical protein
MGDGTEDTKKKGSESEQPRKGGKMNGPEQEEEKEIFGDFGFSTFVLSLSTSALVYLGELPDLTSNAIEVNLPLAKQTISLIEMLKEKTKGNLGKDEDDLLSNVLYDLRVKYVKASNK